MPGHPSVAILPGLIALAEERGATGRDVIAAFSPDTRPPAASAWRCGRGITAAASTRPARSARLAPRRPARRLLGLDAEATGRALGIAGTQAAGLKSQFGTMCKPFHAGKASQNGLLAARLAARGFSSRPDLVECDQGFATTHGPDFNPEAALAEPPAGFHVFANLFKYHAACYMTHAPIECARQLRERAGCARTTSPRSPLGQRGLRAHLQHPGAGRRARSKFSLRQTVAMALTGIDTASLGAYSVATATDPALVKLRERLELDFARRSGRGRSRARRRAARRPPIRRATTPAFRPPISPRRATASPPSSTRWSSRCSAPPAPANCAR